MAKAVALPMKPIQIQQAQQQQALQLRSLVLAILVWFCLAMSAQAQPAPAPAPAPVPGQGPQQGQAGSGVFSAAITVGEEAFEAGSVVLESFAVLGILGVAAMAATGRMPWGWAFGLIGGLSILLIAQPLREWVVEMGTDQEAESLMDIANLMTGAVDETYEDARDLVYLFAAICIIALAALGIMGRFPWSWFFAITGALVIIGAAEQIISIFVTSEG